jgi:hypothetical protein
MSIHSTFALLLSLVCLHTNGHAQNNNSPTLEEVSQHFFSHYEYFQPAHHYFNFERHPDGYYVTLLNTDRSAKASELIYNFQTQSFETINLCPQRAQPTDSTRVDYTYLSDHDQYWTYNAYQKQGFDLYPFYGYRGWYNDVINLYEGTSSLTDDQLHALARAYQHQLSALFSNALGFAVATEQFELPPGPGHMTESQLARFMDIHNKRLAAYRKLIAHNPTYKTPVGPVTTKYANEVMDAYLLLAYHQDERTAKGVIEKNIYNDYFIKTARNILRSCPKDAILYTWGDSDTYPLYYVQAMEGFRTDVIVANSSLLAVPRYFRYVYNGPFDAKPLATNFPDAFFQKTHVLTTTPTSGYPDAHIDEWYASLSPENRIELYQPGNLIYLEVPNKVKIPVPPNAPPYQGLLSDTIDIHIDAHITNDQATPLDILYSNQWQRPVCYTLTCRVNLWELWDGYMVQEGIVNRIHASKQSPDAYKNTPYKATIHTDKSFDLWMNTFEWETSQPITHSDLSPYHQMYLITAYQLIDQFITEGDSSRALQVLHTMPDKFPDAISPWGSIWANIFRLADRLEDHQLASRIAVTILQNYEADVLSEYDKQFKRRMIEDFRQYDSAHPSEELSTLLKRMDDN